MLESSNRKAAASFGVAVASLYAAPELSADIIGINFNPGSVAFTSASTLRTVSITSAASNAFVGGFGQWNDSIGQTIYSDGNMQSFKIASVGEILDPSTFAGSGGLGFSGSQTGTFYIGFKQIATSGGSAVPEPGTTGLAALALGVVGLRRRAINN